MMAATTGPAAPADMLVAPLRRDVTFLPGRPDADGSPTGMLHDAFRDTFDVFGWREGEILRRLVRPIALDELHRDLCGHTTVNVSREELALFVRSLHRRGLLQSSARRAPGEYLAEAEQARRGTASWLLTHYLFFRIPLFRPDAFLRNTLWLPGLLASRVAVAVYVLALIALPFLLAPRLGAFGQSLAPFIALRGALWMSLAVGAIKIVHEFGHAYAAARRGMRVRTMGVAFMLLFPIPYCDVTDAWRLDRRGRFAVDFAGVRAELIVALFSLDFWCLAPPGRFRDVCLILGTASILSTLLTNLNPGMRFDGYYLMADLTGVDNLGARASALLRHCLHRAILGVDAGDPEPLLGRGKRALITLYALYACLYRLGLYFGIALLVYRSLPKVVGVGLFAVEIFVFILRPAWREGMLAVRASRGARGGIRRVALGCAAGAFLLWLLLPLPRRVRLDACVSSAAQITLLTPDYGRVAVNNLRRGAVISAGEVMFALENDELDADIALAELELAEAAMALDGVAGNVAARERLRDSLAREERLKSLLASRRARKSLLAFRAESECVVLDAAPGLVPGTWLGTGAFVGRLLPLAARPHVTAYLPEDAVNRVGVGDAVVFVPANAPGTAYSGRIAAVSPVSTATVEEAVLAEPHGGSVPVLPRPGAALAPAAPVYRTEVALDAADLSALRLGQVGAVRGWGRPASLVVEAWHWLVRVALRESGV